MTNMNKYVKHEQVEPYVRGNTSNNKEIFSDRTASEKRFLPSNLLMALNRPNKRHIPSENQTL